MLLTPKLLMAGSFLLFRFQAKCHVLGDVLLSHPTESISLVTLYHITFFNVLHGIYQDLIFSYSFIYCSLVSLHIFSFVPTKT